MVPLPLLPSDPERLGGYELIGRLGAGGQGVVYLGRRAGAADTDPRVAVKLLHTQLLGNTHARARFVRELAVLQRVAGFCTAQMLEADMAGDRPYIVSEFVPGPSLQQLVRGEGPRAGADLDRLAIGTVTALAAIHRAGIVHRDFKPHNVLIGPDGPRVIDFGIARALDAGATMTSQIVGTPAYMAPEQFSDVSIGPSADLFAWGITLLFAATGREPFGGGPLPAVMYRVLNETPDVSALPAGVAEVVAACLAKDPLSRPTAEDTLLRLLGQRDTFAGPRPQQPRPQAPAPPHNEPPPQRPTPRYAEPSRGIAPQYDEPSQSYGEPRPPGRAPQYGESSAYGGPPDPYGTPRSASAPTVSSIQASSSNTPQMPAAAYGSMPEAQTESVAYAPQDHMPAPSFTGHGGLRRTPSLIIGLVLAMLLAVLDIATLALFVADPSLSKGEGAYLAASSAFAVLAMVTVVAAVVGWRGSRGAVWTVIVVRLAREALWAVWAVELQARLDASRQIQAYLFHLAFTAAIVALLAIGLRAGGRRALSP